MLDMWHCSRRYKHFIIVWILCFIFTLSDYNIVRCCSGAVHIEIKDFFDIKIKTTNTSELNVRACISLPTIPSKLFVKSLRFEIGLFI